MDVGWGANEGRKCIDINNLCLAQQQQQQQKQLQPAGKLTSSSAPSSSSNTQSLPQRPNLSSSNRFKSINNFDASKLTATSPSSASSPASSSFQRGKLNNYNNSSINHSSRPGNPGLVSRQPSFRGNTVSPNSNPETSHHSSFNKHQQQPPSSSSSSSLPSYSQSFRGKHQARNGSESYLNETESEVVDIDLFADADATSSKRKEGGKGRMDGKERERMKRDRKLDVSENGKVGKNGNQRKDNQDQFQKRKKEKVITQRKITILDGISVTNLSDLIGVSYGKKKHEAVYPSILS
jgi:hypothetical protein